MAVRIELKPDDSLHPNVIAKRIQPAVDKIAVDATRKKAQKSLDKLADALKQLPNGLDKEPWPSLKPGVKLDSAAQAKQLLAKLNASENKDIGKLVADRYGDVKEHAEDVRDLLGKDRAVADALKALAEMVVEGHLWTLACERFASRCTDWLSKEQKRLEEMEAGSTGASSDTTRMIEKTRTALKMVRSGGGEVTYPFLAVDCRTDLFVYVAADAKGGGAEERVRSALGEAGKGATMIRGDCGFLNRKIYFASPKLSGGTYAVRFQKRLQADLGQRLPIGVGTDKSALETVDADDFDDPLDFLIAQGGPLASRAKACKSRREAILKELKNEGILASGGVNARQAENLLERAEAAAANSDLADFERALDTIKKDVIQAFRSMRIRTKAEEGEFWAAFKEIKPSLDALSKDIKVRIDEVATAVKEEVLPDTANAAAQARRREFRDATKDFDAIAPRIKAAADDAWAEDLFSEGMAVIETLKRSVKSMTDALAKDRAEEAQARKDKAKEEKKKAEAAKAKPDAK